MRRSLLAVRSLVIASITPPRLATITRSKRRPRSISYGSSCSREGCCSCNYCGSCRTISSLTDKLDVTSTRPVSSRNAIEANVASSMTRQASSAATNSGSIPGSPSRRSSPRAALVNGRQMAAEILYEVKNEVRLMKNKYGYAPGLAVIMVGSRRDSAKYVAMKDAVARTAGLESFSVALPETSTHQDVLKVIDEFNHNDRCHGILLQLPLPGHLDPRALLGAIKLEKDVECFHPMNTGRLSAWRRTVVAPCTPRGVMEMLNRLHISVKGMHAVVLGESSVVGLPMALMLNAARATVTMVHAQTVDPERFVRQADLVVAAVGVPELVKREWLKPGAVVIDVGINFVKDETRREGFRIVGDVAPCVRDVASVVSPVPGGVGPMTVIMLIRNCVDMALLKTKWSGVTDWIQHEQAAENARRMQGAVLDLALGKGGGDVGGHEREQEDKGKGNGKKTQKMTEAEAACQNNEKGNSLRTLGGRSAVNAVDNNGGDDDVSYAENEDSLAVKRAAEAQKLMERVGDEIDEAELLTIINDTERNAYSLLSFFEFSSAHSHSHDPTDPTGTPVTITPNNNKMKRLRNEAKSRRQSPAAGATEGVKPLKGLRGGGIIAPMGEFHWSKEWPRGCGSPPSPSSSSSSRRREGEEKRLAMLQNFRQEAAAKFGGANTPAVGNASDVSGDDQQHYFHPGATEEWWLQDLHEMKKAKEGDK